MAAKGMLTVGPTSLVERMLLQLAAAGIKEVTLVLGHDAGAYASLCRRYETFVRPVLNVDYRASGSLGSLVCALRTRRSGELILCFECDLLFEDRVVDALLDGRTPLVVVAALEAAGDEVFVESRDGRLNSLSKNKAELLAEDIIGQYIGVSRLSDDLCVALVAFFEQHRTRGPLEYDLDGFQALATFYQVECRFMERLVWCEIDDETQLNVARNSVWPRLVDASPEIPS
jgi:choline kinase